MTSKWRHKITLLMCLQSGVHCTYSNIISEYWNIQMSPENDATAEGAYEEREISWENQQCKLDFSACVAWLGPAEPCLECEILYQFTLPIELQRPSQWPCGLRHEPSSPVRMLGSWIRIPVKAWMSVCVYSVLFCVQVAALWRADPPSKESYRLCID
jgi:hypothetical protein